MDGMELLKQPSGSGATPVPVLDMKSLRWETPAADTFLRTHRHLFEPQEITVGTKPDPNPLGLIKYFAVPHQSVSDCLFFF
jgi:hypothetical protein